MRVALFARSFVVAAMLPFFQAFLSIAKAEPVTLSVTYETQLGQSIFASGPHPLLGNGDVTKSLKLSPHEYSVWQATVDLPPGAEFEVQFLLRSDAPNTLGQATPLATVGGQQVSVPADLELGPVLHTVRLQGQATSGTVFLRTPPYGQPVAQYALVPEGGATPANLFRVEFPYEQTWRGWAFNFQLSNTTGADLSIIPANNLGILHGVPLFWRHNQAWLYEPPEQFPASNRQETFQFTLPGFRARTIRVLLPRDYDRNPDKRYPVLYAQDGQNVFSPGGPFGSWDLNFTVESLIQRGEIPELIVVAVNHGENDRIMELIPGWASYQGNAGRGTEFLTQIRDTLMPEINSRYRTLTGPENTGHIGSSLGGLIGFEAAHNFSDTFGQVAAMSTAFWIARQGTGEETLNSLLAKGPGMHARLYLDSGNAGNSNDDYANTVYVRDAMIASGHVFGRDFHHVVGIGDQHNEPAWKRRAPDVLRWMWGPRPARQEPAATSTTWMIGTSGGASTKALD